jgi:hypothetical protein
MVPRCGVPACDEFSTKGKADMALSLCAACNQRVEDGAIRCPACDATLAHPGAFHQALGWVVVAISTIPFAISEVTTGDRNLVPIFIACGLLALGVFLLVLGKLRAKSVGPTTVPDPSAQIPTPPR